MTGPRHDHPPALRGHFQLTYIPTYSPEEEHGAILMLSNGDALAIASGFSKANICYLQMQHDLRDLIMNTDGEGPTFSVLKPWKHVPAEAEELAASMRQQQVGLVSLMTVPVEIAYERLNRDASIGKFPIMQAAEAARAIGISRQAISSAIRRKSLTRIEVDTEPGRVYLLVDEVRAARLKRTEKIHARS